MQRLEVSGAVRPIYGSLGVKRLTAVGPLLVGLEELVPFRLVIRYFLNFNSNVTVTKKPKFPLQ